MKHVMHSALDLPIDYEIDLINRTITMNVDWIDTSLIESFLRSVEIKNLNGFAIALNVAGSVKFDLQLIERDFEPRESTLVMRLKNNNLG